MPVFRRDTLPSAASLSNEPKLSSIAAGFRRLRRCDDVIGDDCPGRTRVRSSSSATVAKEPEIEDMLPIEVTLKAEEEPTEDAATEEGEVQAST